MKIKLTETRLAPGLYAYTRGAVSALVQQDETTHEWMASCRSRRAVGLRTKGDAVAQARTMISQVCA